MGGDRAGEVGNVGWSQPGQGPERWHFSPLLSIRPVSNNRHRCSRRRDPKRRTRPSLPVSGLCPHAGEPRNSPSASKQKIDGQAPRFPAQPGVGRVAIYFRASDWLPGKDAESTAGLGSGRDGRTPNGPEKSAWHNRRIKAVQLWPAEPAQLSSRRSLLQD